MRLLFYLLCAALLLPCAAASAAAGEPKIVLASLQPIDECANPATPWLTSGCVDVPKARDPIKVPCKTKPGMCPLTWALPKDEERYWANALPTIVVVKPMPRRAVVQTRRAAGSGRVSKAGRAARALPQIAPNNAGHNKARMVGLQVAQIGASMAGGPLAGMAVCAIGTFAFMAQDGAEAKEVWSPGDTVGNLLLSTIGCSPIGFVLRMATAKTDQERMMALLGGGLGFVNHPAAALAGQALMARQMVAPATTTTAQAAKPAVHATKRQVRHNRVALSQ